MNGLLGHDSALETDTRPGTTWANEMNFVIPLIFFSTSKHNHFRLTDTWNNSTSAQLKAMREF